MKIGIDAIAAVGLGGNGTYSRELIEHLLKEDQRNSYELFGFLHDLPKRNQFNLPINAAHWHAAHPYLSRSFFPLPHIAEVNAFLLRMARACARR